MLELSIIVVIFIALLNYMIVRDYAYPPFIFSVLWVLVLTVHYLTVVFNIEDVYQLSDSTLIIFPVGVMYFSVGGLLSYLMNSKKGYPGNHSVIISSITGKYIDLILFYLPIICLPLFVQRAFSIAAASGIDDFFLGLKAQQLEGGDIEGYGLLRYVGMAAIFNAVYRSYVEKSSPSGSFHKIKYYISLVVALTYTIFTLGRSIVVTLIVMLIGVKVMMRKMRVRDVLLAIGFFVVIFFLIAVVLGKGGDISRPFSENVAGVSDSLLKYYVGPLHAFDYFLNSNYDLHYGEYSLRFFHALLHKIGLIDRPPLDLVNPFIFIPYPANVYTIYYTYVNDFGIMMSFIFIGLFGFVNSYVYFGAVRGSYVYSMLYALLLYPLAMSTFQDQYLSLLSQWVQYSIMLVMTTIFVQKKGGALPGADCG